MLRHQPRQHRLAFRRRLQECAGRQRDRRLAHAHRRRRALRDQFAVARQPRQPMGLGEPRQRRRVRAAPSGPEPRTSTSSAGIGRGHLDVERLPSGRAPRRAPMRRGARRERGASTGQRSIETMWCAPTGRKADFEHAMRRCAARGRRRAAAPRRARRSVRRPARRAPPAAAPRRRGRASSRGSAQNPSAGSGSRRTRRNADRPARCAPRSRVSTRNRWRRSGWPGDRLDLHRLARQRVGHEHGPVGRVGDAVAAMAEAGDCQAFGHAGAVAISGR